MAITLSGTLMPVQGCFICSHTPPTHTHTYGNYMSENRKCTAESSLNSYVNVGKLGIVWTKTQLSKRRRGLAIRGQKPATILQPAACPTVV